MTSTIKQLAVLSTEWSCIRYLNYLEVVEAASVEKVRSCCTVMMGKNDKQCVLLISRTNSSKLIKHLDCMNTLTLNVASIRHGNKPAVFAIALRTVFAEYLNMIHACSAFFRLLSNVSVHYFTCGV
jgi:hypothetical protein